MKFARVNETGGSAAPEGRDVKLKYKILLAPVATLLFLIVFGVVALRAMHVQSGALQHIVGIKVAGICQPGNDRQYVR